MHHLSVRGFPVLCMHFLQSFKKPKFCVQKFDFIHYSSLQLIPELITRRQKIVVQFTLIYYNWDIHAKNRHPVLV